MVALAGPGWRLAPSLVLYVEEVDRRFPSRDRTSDGSIGDLAHASRESDHNPYDGWVHAIDLDEDVAPGIDLDRLWAYAIAKKDPRDRYLIYEGQIVKSYIDSAGHPAWKPYPYTGLNDHDHHLHRSIRRTTTARTDLRTWGIAAAFPEAQPKPKPRRTDMALIAKKANDRAWWSVSANDRRHLTDRQEAAEMVYVGLAEWDDGEPFVLPDHMIERLRIVRAA